MPKSLWLFVVAAVAFLGAFMALRTPEPVPANAPVSVFSAQRAMADAKEIAKAPHPTGSTEIVRVRGYVVDRLRQIGLATDLRPGQGVSANPFGRADVSAAAVQNIVGVIPGKAPGKPALLVMSHYDTVRNSPGAADDTAGVASALEIARMIHAGPQPERDVIFLFTDAEEAGLLGAQAFFASDPLAAHVGAVINMEARGDDGLAAMFETGPANAGLIAMMAQKGLKPNANSMAAAVYHKMPNGTDFTEAMRKDLPGLNFAFEDDQLAYHSPLATPGHLDPGALQHLGETAGAMATALASAPEIPKASGNAVYGDYLGQFLIHYPPSVGWVLLAVAGLLTGVSLIRAIMAEKLRLLEVARGIGVSVMIVLFTGLVYDVISRLFHLPDYIPVYAALVHGEAFVGALLLGGLALSVAIAGAGSAAKGRVTVTLTCALAALIASLAYRHPDMFAIVSGVVTALLGFACLGKRIGVWGQWGGALLLALALGVTLQVVEPGVTPLIVWPLLLGSLMAIAVSLLGKGDPSRSPGLIIVAVLATPGLAQVLAWGGFVFTAVGAAGPATNLVTLLAALPLAAPLFWTASRGPVGRVLAVLCGLAALGALSMLVIGPNDRRPGLTQAFYLSDPGEKLWMIGSRLDLNDWSRDVMKAGDTKPAKLSAPPLITGPLEGVRAKPADVPGPVVTAERIGNRLILRAIPSNSGETLIVQLKPSANLTHGRLNGREITFEAKAGQWTTLSYEAPPPEGITLALDAPDHGALETATAEIASGWPKAFWPLPPKPAHRMGWGWSDTTIAVSRLSATW